MKLARQNPRGAALMGFAVGVLIVFLFFPSRGSQTAVSLGPASLGAATLGAVSPAREARTDLDQIERNVVDVFQRVSPSVVNVSNNARRRASFNFDEMEIPQGSGTGIIWDQEGHVVTNYHVIRGADAIGVTLSDQKTVPARIVGWHPDKDLAVLRIDQGPEKLTPIQPGSSADLMVGQTVLAIGNPFGLDHTLTTGVVSALGREIKALTGRPIQDVIQTDAAINPGNSGGPLLDARGKLIGLNTAIFSPVGTNAGIGFAVPVDTVKQVVRQLIEHGRVVRPGLGVKLFPDAWLAARRVRISGAIIAEVQRRSAAERAGLRGAEETEEGIRLGDIIIAIAGKKVASSNDLFLVLEKHQIGDDVEVTYTRDGRERKTKVKLQSLDAE